MRSTHKVRPIVTVVVVAWSVSVVCIINSTSYANTTEPIKTPFGV